ncbi:MAG: ABC transporter permease subunit, partial [Bacteroidota bacterium]|nr:ABC transporter permease subunit [Bacteroidota bacterium]
MEKESLKGLSMNNMNPRINYRKTKSKVFQGLVMLFAFAITIPLIAIIFYIFKEGITKINWNFLINIPKPVGEIGGGIANALLGSLLIVLVAAVIAIPIGIMCGIYLSENQKGRLPYYSRLCVDVLQGVPSIVIGIVIYFWLVKPIGTFSAFSGSVALSIMMLPIVIRSTEETLKLLPFSLKEAGLALGLPYHRVILRVVVPCGISGILSGV